MTNVSIEEVALRFKSWRKKKKFNSEPIPGELLDQVAGLIRHYKKYEIVKALKISNVTWESRRLQDRVNFHSGIIESKPVNWIEVKATGGFGLSKIRLRRGTDLEMEVEVGKEELLGIIGVFVSGGGPWSN